MTHNSESNVVQLRADINKYLSESLDWFNQNYDIVRHHSFNPDSARIYLGQKKKQICRYCGLVAPQVRFKKLAYALPDQVGNNWLYDLEECDSCNEHFAKYVEDDFAKWTLPWRSTGRIIGKNGIPSLKSHDKQFRMDVSTKTSAEAALSESGARHDLKIYMKEDDNRRELDPLSKCMTLTLERQPYVPMGVFKCLVKMAVAVMSTEEQQCCTHLKKWILLRDHTFESYQYKPLTIDYQFVPGPLPNDHLSYWLLRRKPDRADHCLYMQFVLQLGNHIFQIALPMHIEDRQHLDIGTFQSCLWPNTWADIEHQMRYGRSGYKSFDMSGTSQVRDETVSLAFHYEKIVNEP